METSHQIISRKISELKSKYPNLAEEQDYRLFTILCIKIFFYDEDTFDIDEVLESVVDGAKDGGIDAIFVDPQDTSNNLHLIQSKYLGNTALDKHDIIEAISKMRRCIQHLNSHKVEDYNENLVNRYYTARGQMSKEDTIRYIFYTSYDPSSNKVRAKLEKEVRNEFQDITIDIQFGNDICKQIECTEKAKPCVDSGHLNIDDRSNFLRYGENAVLVNISAKSLCELYNIHQNSLFGLNLRYYIRNKNVDEGIHKTIRDKPQDFWYRNNGITIICDDYELDGTVVRLKNFSIINGGQTTHCIGRVDIEEDFYLLCKIVKSQGSDRGERDTFVMQISQATNAQKPIKPADLMANSPEQLDLKGKLAQESVCYITKRGEKINKRKYKSYQTITIQKFGQLSLAAALQHPGTARNKPKSVFSDGFYHRIYRKPAVKKIVDISRVEYFYSVYRKEVNYDKERDATAKKVIANSTMYQLAAISLLCSLQQNQISMEELCAVEGKGKKLEDFLMQECERDHVLFRHKLDPETEKEKLKQLFDLITMALCDAYEAETPDKSKDVTQVFKSDDIYYCRVITKLLRYYRNSMFGLESVVSVLCGTQEA